MKLSDKQKYIVIALLAVMLVLAVIYTVFAAIDYISALRMSNNRQNVTVVPPEEIYEEDVPKRNIFITENEHDVSSELPLRFFDDAVFVGDSRTEGLFLYSGIAENSQATAYAWRGFTTQDIIDNKKFKVDGKYLTGVDALRQNKSFTKVYIMLGVNELCPDGAQDFIERYDKIVQAALEANPDARIIVQSIIPLAKWKSDLSSYVNNQNTADFNAALLEYAEANGYIWLDVGELLSDKEGNLHGGYDCGDGIHLTELAYKNWLEYLSYYTYL